MAELLRFYNDFHPAHYDLNLDINREHKTIKGSVLISGEALNETISIHQKYLQIKQVTVKDHEVPFVVDDENDALKITLGFVGDVQVKIVYETKLTDTMMGIYPSYYEVAGQKKQLIGTQFETNAARQAFPCVDEPEAKATFTLALKYDEHEGETTLANTPEVKVENGVHYFEETVKMSTYLVAFAFGELQGKKTKTNSGVEIGVFATKAHQPKELDFALDIAKRSIEFYEEYYQTPYPLKHSWQLALPDFSAGAMENWGLVTYREAYLLVDPENTALDQKKLVATVITHELAHQWFGDLVTMKWWDDLWLNESFANMMEYVAVDALEPSWNIWETFQTSEAVAALTRDATDGVQSVHVEVKNPAEIDTLFDGAIVYAKGSRLLVMVRSLIGDEALRSGLKAYFAKHQYGNASGDDLWQALGQACGLDIGAVMHSWLEQPGYPVVKVELKDDALHLSQKQFFIGQGQDQGRLWQIPLNSNFKDVPTLMKDQTLVIEDYTKLRQQQGQAFRLNLENNAHFIVEYDQVLLDDILAEQAALDNISKLQLMQDLRYLAQGQVTTYAQLIPLLALFKDNHSEMVNSYLYTVVNDLKQFVAADSAEETALKQFTAKLSSANFERLGLLAKAAESDDDQLTRPYILNAALYAENEAAKAQAHDLFQKYEADLLALPAGIRPYILKNEVVNYGDKALFERLLNAYRKAVDPSYKKDLSYALTKTQDPELLASLVASFEDADTIKPQDLRGWFGAVLANDFGQELAWKWIRDDWSWLEATVGGDMEFPTYITVIARIFKTQERLDEFKAFFADKLDQPALTREIKMDTEVIQSRVNLISRQKEAVVKAITAAL